MVQGIKIMGDRLTRAEELAISVGVDLIGLGTTIVVGATLGGFLPVDITFAAITGAWVLAMFWADGIDPIEIAAGVGLGGTALIENFILLDLLPIATISWAVKWSGIIDE